jgi:hypothetical protein
MEQEAVEVKYEENAAEISAKKSTGGLKRSE